MKYALIKEHAGLYAISLMCQVLGVSRTGYYRWLSRSASKRNTRKAQLKSLVKSTFEEFETAYGAPRITGELNALGHRCSLNYIAKIMQETAC